jgi:GNAT superfamily N-acetyltransferase
MIQFAETPGCGPTLFTVAGRPTIALTVADAPLVERLFARSEDYFRMVAGRPAGPDTALEALRDGPAERVPDNLVNLGIFDRDGGLAGMIGLARHHRVPDQWYLGLLLLAPAWRGHGIGSTAYWSAQHWIERQGGRSILLGVVEENHRAHRFWQSLGFGTARRYPARQIGLRQHVVIEYEKTLSPR